MPGGVFDQLIVVAVLGALLPGPRLLRRLLVGAAAVSMLFYTALYLDGATRPRYLIGVSMGIVVLTGTFAGLLGRWLPAALRWLPVALLGGLLSVDTLAYLSAWGTMHSRMTGAELPTLPAAPTPWTWRYLKQTDHNYRDLTIYGAMALVELVQANPGGVAIPRLRDERWRHLSAVAEREGRPWGLLDTGDCCGPQTIETCARRVVQGLSDAGMLLALPTTIGGVRRVNRQEDGWMNALTEAATSAGGTSQSEFWLIRPASGSGGSFPCQQRRR